MNDSKSILITTGDPAGCGPYISLKAVEKLKKKDIKIFLVGDYKILAKFDIFFKLKDKINFIDVRTPSISKVKFGYPSKISGKAALSYLDIGLSLLKEKKISRLVTAPVSKEAIKLVYKDFLGHTEYLQNYFGSKEVEMMMVSKKIKLVLFTRHTLLKSVSSLIKKDKLIKTFSVVYDSLQKLFKIKRPKILVTSFNPHASLSTYMANEEKEIFKAISSFGKKIFGPYPADTVFVSPCFRKYDCIICLYHDQGMIPFKMLSFKDGVNLTLGLPIIRTSPAHGVAFDVVRKNKKPFYSSMLEAIRLALKLEYEVF